MKLLANSYYSEKKTKVFWISLIIITVGITYFQPEILKMMNREPHYSPGLSFLLGYVFASLLSPLLNFFLRPKVRICDHFLICNYDRKVITWDQVVHARMKGNNLVLTVPKAQLQKECWVSLSSVPKRTDLLSDIENVCETRGIPFER